MTAPINGKLLYHLTHIDNIKSILEKGLLPRNKLKSNDFKDTADQDIISGRHEYNVDLSDYVPFHFYVKNPYDGAVCKIHGAENMAIIAINRPKTNAYAKAYYVIPQHPLSGTPRFLPYFDGIQEIKWNLLDNTGYTRDYSDPEIKSACLAECDVDGMVTPSQFCYIYVKTEKAKKRILRAPIAKEYIDIIQVNPHMFP